MKDTSSVPHVKSTTTKKEVITTTFLESLKSRLRTQTVVREEQTTVYDNGGTNSSRNSLAYYYNEAVGMFDKPLKNQSPSNSLRISGKALKDSPILNEGVKGIIRNLDEYNDLPKAETPKTPLLQLSELSELSDSE